MLWWWAGLTFGDILDKAADIFPENEALLDREHRLTHAKLRKKANKLAIGRMDLDIKSMDRVLVQLPRLYE